MAEPGSRESQAAAPGNAQRFEILLAIGLLLFGLVALPAMVYLTGLMLLGEYSGGSHLGAFFGDFLRDLAGGSARAWFLVLGPYLLVQVGRLIFLQFGAKAREGLARDAEPEPKVAPTKARPEARERREPTFKI